MCTDLLLPSTGLGGTGHLLQILVAKLQARAVIVDLNADLKMMSFKEGTGADKRWITAGQHVT
jgi:hypothetical protein